jgi:hypothetical protein
MLGTRAFLSSPGAVVQVSNLRGGLRVIPADTEPSPERDASCSTSISSARS